MGEETIRRPRLGLFVAFFVADLLMLAAAVWIWWQGHRPLTLGEMFGIIVCVALGAWFGVWPFVLRERAWLRWMETQEVLEAIDKIQQLDRVAEKVEMATNSWQLAQDQANRTAQAAEAIARRMEEERQRFIEFLKEAQDAERAHLRLEVEKLKRGENDWLQVLAFILDHVQALFAGAVRSGKREVMEQVGKFRAVVFDAARRVGLVPVFPQIGEPFDPDHHVVPDDAPKPQEGHVVQQVLGHGYRFRGEWIRPALVLTGPPQPEEVYGESGSPHTTMGLPEEAQVKAAAPAGSQSLPAGVDGREDPPGETAPDSKDLSSSSGKPTLESDMPPPSSESFSVMEEEPSVQAQSFSSSWEEPDEPRLDSPSAPPSPVEPEASSDEESPQESRPEGGA